MRNDRRRGARRRHRLRPGGERAGRRARAGRVTPSRSSTRIARAFRRLPAGLRGHARSSGSGSTATTSKRPGIEQAGAFASVTSGDNSNILCARIARETYAHRARRRPHLRPRRALIYQRLGIPTVATVAWTTDQVLRRLLPSEAQQRLGRPDRARRPRRAADPAQGRSASKLAAAQPAGTVLAHARSRASARRRS